MSQLYFDQEEVKREENYFKRVKLSPEQRKQLMLISEIVCKHLDISCLAVRGFFLRAIKQWQQDQQQQVIEFMYMPATQKAMAAKEIFQIVELEYLQKILKNPEAKARLHEIMQEAYEYYITNY